MKTPLIVLAAGYISETLYGDLGKIRTSLLPVGGGSLVEFNCAIFGNDFESYVACHYSDLITKSYLKIKARNVIEINGDASIREALVQSLDHLIAIYKHDFSFQLLFGDTTVKPNTDKNFISLISSRQDFSDWTSVYEFGGELIFQTPARQNESIVAGYFGFSSAMQLRNALLNSNSFYDAVSQYHRTTEKLNYRIAENWLDFGRINTLHMSRMNLLTSRTFNSVKADKTTNTIRKSSRDLKKIREEINWYTQLEDWNMSHIAPHLKDYSFEEGWYETEYCLQPNMAEIFLFSKKSMGYWHRFFTAIEDYFSKWISIANLDPTQSNIDKIRAKYLEKLDTRMKLLRNQSPELFKVKFNLGINQIYLDDYINLIRLDLEDFEPKPMRIIHGDFFFGNIFFWDELNRIVCIDPLGISYEDIVFDLHYDFAKLSHSIFGGYDFLAANLFSSGILNEIPFLEIPWQEHHNEIKLLASDSFNNFEKFADVSREQIRKLEAFLFLTLAPLHQESSSRQLASIIRSTQVYVGK